DRHEAGLGGLAAVFPLADRVLEAVVDLAREQVLERAPVAFRKRGDDHLVGRARAGEEVLGVEAVVLGRDRVEAARDRGGLFGDPLPAVGGRRGRLDLLRRRLGTAGRQRHHLVARRGADRITRGIGIVGRPLAPRALNEHAAQAQGHAHRQREENDRVDVHVGAFSDYGADDRTRSSPYKRQSRRYYVY